jgi:hypothetical protein
MTSTLTYGVRAPAAAFSLVRAQRRGEPLGRARALSGIKTPARFSSGRAKRHSLGARTVATAVTEPSSEAARVEEVKLSSSVLPGTAPSNGNPDDRTFVAKGARDVTFFRATFRSDATQRSWRENGSTVAPSVSFPPSPLARCPTPRRLNDEPRDETIRDAFPKTDLADERAPRVSLHWRRSSKCQKNSQCVSSAPTRRGSWRA